jgi:hypothetical protein
MGKGFWRNERGSAVERFAVLGAVVTLMSFFAASGVEQLASKGGLPTIAFLSSDQYIATKGKSPDFGSIDYSTTGSINNRITLSPCTSEEKSR